MLKSEHEGGSAEEGRAKQGGGERRCGCSDQDNEGRIEAYMLLSSGMHRVRGRGRHFKIITDSSFQSHLLGTP